MLHQLACTLLLFEDDPSIRAMLVAFFSAQGAKVLAVEDTTNYPSTQPDHAPAR
jgi:DNA-binding response OmpR family regulator